MFIDGLAGSTLNMNRFYGHDTEINGGISILMMGHITTANITAAVFNNTYSGSNLDTSNFLISLDELASTGNSSITFSGLDIQN